MANLQQEVFNLRRQVASLKKQVKGYTPIPMSNRRSPFEPRELSYMPGPNLIGQFPDAKSYTDQELERIENAQMKLYSKSPRYKPQNLSRRISSIQKKIDKGYTPISERGRKYIGYKGTESRLSELPYPVPPGEKYEQEPIALLGYVPKPHEYDFGGYRRTPFAPIAPFDPSNRRVAEAERKIDTLYRTSIRGYPTLKQKIAEAREELADAEAVRASYQDQEYDPMLPTQTPMNRNFMENLMMQAEEEEFRRFQEMKMLGVL